MEAVVYTVTDASRISALYASFYDGTSWGEPVSVTQGEGNIGSFSAQFLSDGTFDYSDTNAADNTGALALGLADVSLEGAVATSDGDETKVTVFVVNRRQTELVNVTLTASSADGTFLGSATVPSLPVGTSQFVEIQIAGALTDNSLVTVTASGGL